MIIHSIISEYDIFRGPVPSEHVPTEQIPPKSKSTVPVVTDPKKFINKKIRVN